MQSVTMNSLVVAAALVLLGDGSFAGEPIDFQPIPLSLELPEGVQLDECSAVDFDSQGRLYLFHRGKQPILCFEANGKFVRSWGDGIIKAHGLRIDSHDNVWVTDIGLHLVMKFSTKGRLLYSLGKPGKPGLGENQFDKPTDVAIGPEGEIYVADGYGNSRVVKFDAKGKFLKTWGKPGKGRGEFDLPHSICIDKQGRVLVGDRENNRVQIFDTEGKLLDIWTGFAPYGMELDRKGRLFVADGRASQVLLVNSTGKVQSRWGEKGFGPGQFDLPHMLAFDAHGDLYIAEVGGMRLQKLERK